MTATADVTMMHAIHAALRRDLDRLERVADLDLDNRDVSAAVTRGWELFKSHLHIHHTAEDTSLWPRLRERLSGRADDLDVLAAMEEEHSQIPPAIAAVDSGLDARDPDRIRDSAARLHSLIEDHLSHEERAALPMIESLLTRADWRDFLHEQRNFTPAEDRPVYLTWLLEDLDPELVAKTLAELPPPGRVVYRVVLRRRFARQRRWL